MGRIRKKDAENDIVVDLKEFLDLEVPSSGPARFILPLGFLIGVAAMKIQEDLDQVPFLFSRVKIELEGKQLKVISKKLPK